MISDYYVRHSDKKHKGTQKLGKKMSSPNWLSKIYFLTDLNGNDTNEAVRGPFIIWNF